MGINELLSHLSRSRTTYLDVHERRGAHSALPEPLPAPHADHERGDEPAPEEEVDDDDRDDRAEGEAGRRRVVVRRHRGGVGERKERGEVQQHEAGLAGLCGSRCSRCVVPA